MQPAGQIPLFNSAGGVACCCREGIGIIALLIIDVAPSYTSKPSIAQLSIRGIMSCSCFSFGVI